MNKLCLRGGSIIYGSLPLSILKTCSECDTSLFPSYLSVGAAAISLLSDIYWMGNGVVLLTSIVAEDTEFNALERNYLNFESFDIP